MNGRSVNMASLAELVGADDEASILCAQLAKAIKRLEAKRDQLDLAGLKTGTDLLNASKERQTALTGLQAEVEKLRGKTERTVKERDQVIQALRNLSLAAREMQIHSDDEEASGRYKKAEQEAGELLTEIDQVTAARRERKQNENSPAPAPESVPVAPEG